MNKRGYIIVLLWLCCCSGAWAQYGPTWHTAEIDSAFRSYQYSGSWPLTFADEFEGSTLDTSLWRIVTGVPRDLELNDQKAWHQPENVSVDNGVLRLISRRELKENMDYPVQWEPFYAEANTDFDFTSAEILTYRLFSYGRYEARIRVPRGKGLWPAFWLFSPNGKMDEIDIFEFWNEGKDTSKLASIHHVAVHYDYDSNGHTEQSTHSYNGHDFYSDYHVFALVHTPLYIRWLVDDTLVYEYPRYKGFFGRHIDENNMQWGRRYRENKLFPCHPYYIILNVAIQSYDNAPDDTTPLPSAMEVDWVRFYEMPKY